MSQKLILPYESSRLAVSYKRRPYRDYWGYEHYGCDYVATGSAKVRASGDGEVITAGFDEKVGNTVCVVYKNALNHRTGKVSDVVARYMHLKSISVEAGRKVAAGDELGIEGNTGKDKWSEHLHVEFDTDIRHPNYSPQTAGGNLIKKGIDTTVDPSALFYRRKDQQLSDGKPAMGWTVAEDFTLPVVAVVTVKEDDIEKLTEDIKWYDAALTKAHQDIAELKRTNAEIRQDVAGLAGKWPPG